MSQQPSLGQPHSPKSYRYSWATEGGINCFTDDNDVTSAAITGSVPKREIDHFWHLAIIYIMDNLDELVQEKTSVTPLLMHCSYVYLALTHRFYMKDSIAHQLTVQSIWHHMALLILAITVSDKGWWSHWHLAIIVRRAGLLWSQQDFEWRWSVPLFKCLTVLEFSFILFDLCLLITFFNFIMNYVPIVTFWIFTYHKIWILSIMFCFIWSYWIIYFLACLEVSWRVVS